MAATSPKMRARTIMPGSSSTVGATRHPASAPMPPARPHPSVVTWPARMPMSSLISGLDDTARKARPTRVQRRTSHSAPSTTSSVAHVPIVV